MKHNKAKLNKMRYVCVLDNPFSSLEPSILLLWSALLTILACAQQPSWTSLHHTQNSLYFSMLDNFLDTLLLCCRKAHSLVAAIGSTGNKNFENLQI